MTHAWVRFTKRTDDPKLRWIEAKLTEMGIFHRRNGHSWHAPILEVLEEDHENAYAFLSEPFDGENGETVDDIADDDPTFLEEEYKAHDLLPPEFPADRPMNLHEVAAALPLWEVGIRPRRNLKGEEVGGWVWEARRKDSKHFPKPAYAYSGEDLVAYCWELQRRED